MIKRLANPQAASNWCFVQHTNGKKIGYVPTMGALHRGHFSLVERSVHENDITCSSIFVNPLQFSQHTDLENYPRDLEKDTALLQRAGCDMVYTGTLAEFFPDVADVHANQAMLAHPISTVMEGLEGEFRPGHLPGVSAIVERLFSTVGACTAYFGEKDFQQTLVVAELAKQVGPSIQIVVCPTVREVSGLAMSSRNQRLSSEQLEVAAKLYHSLCSAQKAWQTGVRTISKLQAVMHDELTDNRICVEYATVRDPQNWSVNYQAGETLQRARALVAAYIGQVRLIDNLRLD